GGFGTLQNPVHVGCSAPELVQGARRVKHEPPGLYSFPEVGQQGEPALSRTVHDAFGVRAHQWGPQPGESIRGSLTQRREDPREIVRPVYLPYLHRQPQRTPRTLHLLRVEDMTRIGWIIRDGDTDKGGNGFFEQLQPFPDELDGQSGHPRDV